MIEKEELEALGDKLNFKMNDEEYDTLKEEFKIILEQMSLISEIEGLEKVEPMTFPFINDDADFREDVVKDMISPNIALKNAKNVMDNQIRVPKVVE